jgi:hypothetical protein
MHDFVVDGNAQRCREASISLERRLGSSLPDALLCQAIQVCRGKARLQGLGQLVEDSSH